MLPTELSTPETRRLVKLYRRLDAPSRRSLLDFAQFLAARIDDATQHPQSASSPALTGDDPESAISSEWLEPRHEPVPENETVVGAIKRLRRVYPMIDGGQVLHQASALMAAHVVQGRPAPEVIVELESLFSTHFERHLEARGRSDLTP